MKTIHHIALLLLSTLTTSLVAGPTVIDFFPESGADVTPPTLSSAAVGTDGTTVTLTFSEPVTRGAGYSTGAFDIDGTVSNNSLTYVSGDGTSTWTMTAASTINGGESLDIDFSGAANSVEDGAGNDLAAITSAAVTNNSTQGAGVTYLINEGFEGAGTPTNFAPDSASTPDYHSTISPLVGSKSMVLHGSTDDAVICSFAAQSTIEVFFHARFSSLPPGSDYRGVFYMAGPAATILLRSNSCLSIYAGSGTTNVDTPNPMVAGTDYYVWFRYSKGIGSNATISVAFSLDGTRPTSGTQFASTSVGVDTATTSGFGFEVADSTSDMTIDHVLVVGGSDVIGNNP